MGSSELMPCFVMLVCTAFAFTIKLSLSQSTSYLVLTHAIPSPVPGRGVGKWLCGAWMLTGVEPLEPSLYFMWLVAKSLQIGTK